jgi:hypothetical protein
MRGIDDGIADGQLHSTRVAAATSSGLCEHLPSGPAGNRSARPGSDPAPPLVRTASK